MKAIPTDQMTIEKITIRLTIAQATLIFLLLLVSNISLYVIFLEF